MGLFSLILASPPGNCQKTRKWTYGPIIPAGFLNPYRRIYHLDDCSVSKSQISSKNWSYWKKNIQFGVFLHASLKFWRNYNLPQDIVSVTFWHFLTKIHIPVKETGYRGNIKRLHCVDCWYPFFFIQFNLTSGYFRVVGNAKFHFKRGAFLKNKYTCMTFSSIE